jgi:hypothetical protein
MTFGFPVEPGRIFSFARSVGDTDAVYRDQLFGRVSGEPLVTPPTFVRSAEHYEPSPAEAPSGSDEWADEDTSDSDPDGASTVHAEQHFEYLAPFRAGQRVTVHTRPGQTWRKRGRTGSLEFFETVTEYRDGEDVLVRSRKVSVRLLDGPPT